MDTTTLSTSAPPKMKVKNRTTGILTHEMGSRSNEMKSFIGKTVKLEPRKKHIVKTASLISNKGGVGKTHTAANMAFYMSQIGKKVLAIDLDLGNSDIANKLGFYCENTISHLLNGRKALDNLIYNTPYGFDMIAGQSGNLRLANLSFPQKQRFINALRRVGSDYDFVLYDLDAGIRSTTLDFALAQDYQIIIVTPQDIVAGYACMKALYHRFVEVEKRMVERDPTYQSPQTLKPFIVINQAINFEMGKSLFNRLAGVARQNILGNKDYHLDMKLLGIIIEDQEKIREAEFNHYLYSNKHGDSRTAQCFHFLAHNLTQYRDPSQQSLAAKLKRFTNLFIKSDEKTKDAE